MLAMCIISLLALSADLVANNGHKSVLMAVQTDTITR